MSVTDRMEEAVVGIWSPPNYIETSQAIPSFHSVVLNLV